jgi:hypothetical protein
MGKRFLITKALEWACGEKGPKTTGEHGEDARYVYPERLEKIIDLLDEYLAEEENEVPIL